MATLNVPDMHCPKCVERITKGLTQDGLDFTVSLETHTVTVNGDGPAVETAMATLDRLGFPATRA